MTQFYGHVRGSDCDDLLTVGVNGRLSLELLLTRNSRRQSILNFHSRYRRYHCARESRSGRGRCPRLVGHRCLVFVLQQLLL